MHPVYLYAARALNACASKHGSLKGSLYALQKESGKHFKQSFLLALKCAQYRAVLDAILSKADLDAKFEDIELGKSAQAIVAASKDWGPDGTQWIVRTALFDLLFGASKMIIRAPEPCALYKALVESKADLERALVDVFESADNAREVAEKEAMEGASLRYARVNTIKATVDEIVADLKESGYELKDSEPKARELKKNLPKIFWLDSRLVPEVVLAFNPSDTIQNHALVKSKKLILQDMSSCVPAVALDPQPRWTVLDACAAPGNKTSHLAALMLSKGEAVKRKKNRLIAVEKDRNRFKILRNTVQQTGADEICKLINADFLSLDPSTDKNLFSVKAILLDPSCSGSGLVKRHELNEEKLGDDRLKSLASFQKAALRHALAFPNVTRVSYSTCSVNEEENEDVVKDILTDSELCKHWRLRNIFPNWKHRGDETVCPGASNCIRIDSELHKTGGFFVAVFERDAPNLVFKAPVQSDEEEAPVKGKRKRADNVVKPAFSTAPRGCKRALF